MKYVNQIGNECLIAAVSMASDVEYRLLRRRKVGKEWMEWVDDGIPSAQTPTNIDDWDWSNETNLLLESQGMEPINPMVAYTRTDTLDGRKLRGVGILLVHYIDDDGSGYHAVAFEDGTIYDSGHMTRPATLEEWLDHYNDNCEIVGWSRHRRKT